MNIQRAYNIWANQYDTNSNKTRDLEAVSLRNTLANLEFNTCLEIGCGTGKNTEWFAKKAKKVTAVDFSEEMLAKARKKISANNVEFIQADITNDWTFTNNHYELVSFSLVLEHIENLNIILRKASDVLNPNGFVYIGELHPFKQYVGTKARFDTDEGQHIVTCFNHNISDFTLSATNNGFEIILIDEYFDDNDQAIIPRILTLLLRKKDKT